jgi:hypothetical protein
MKSAHKQTELVHVVAVENDTAAVRSHVIVCQPLSKIVILLS